MAIGERVDVDKVLNAKEFFDYPYPAPNHAGISTIQSMRNEESTMMTTSDYLVAFSTQSHSYCVGCVDIVNSTKISASMPSHKLSCYYETFLNSMSRIIGKFGGKVIKNVGDCLLYYFPDSVDSKIDGITKCLDCGLAMTKAQNIICRQLTLQKLPCLSYRVSADCGPVLIMNTTDSTSLDLIGPPVNMCTKINRCANCNEFVIGGDLYERVRKLDGYSFQQAPSRNVGFKQSYPVYKVSSQ